MPVLEVLRMLNLTMPPGNAIAVIVGLLALAAGFAIAGKLLIRHEQRRAMRSVDQSTWTIRTPVR